MSADGDAARAWLGRMKSRLDLVIVITMLVIVLCLVGWIWTADWRPFATGMVLLAVLLFVRYVWDDVVCGIRKELGL